MLDRVKDNIFLAYKNCEGPEEEWKFEHCRQDGLQSLFGYKCQYIRDPKLNNNYMEIYCPTMIEKCEKKLQ